MPSLVAAGAPSAGGGAPKNVVVDAPKAAAKLGTEAGGLRCELMRGPLSVSGLARKALVLGLDSGIGLTPGAAGASSGLAIACGMGRAEAP